MTNLSSQSRARRTVLLLGCVLVNGCDSRASGPSAVSALPQNPAWLTASGIAELFGMAPTLPGRARHTGRPTWMRDAGIASPDGYTYVGQMGEKYIAQYRTNDRRNKPPACEITRVNLPQGMTTDQGGTLYLPSTWKVVRRKELQPSRLTAAQEYASSSIPRELRTIRSSTVQRSTSATSKMKAKPKLKSRFIRISMRPRRTTQRER